MSLPSPTGIMLVRHSPNIQALKPFYLALGLVPAKDLPGPFANMCWGVAHPSRTWGIMFKQATTTAVAARQEVAVHFTRRDDFLAAVVRVMALGGPVERRWSFAGYESVVFCDPDGAEVELVFWPG